MNDYKAALKKVWHFIWDDNSIWSWIANIAIAFVLIKFIVYPGLGFVFNTTHPVVAVVSGSMEHSSNLDDWWDESGKWYKSNGIEKDEFSRFSFKNGFNKGDIMALRGKNPENIEVGQVIVFWSSKGDPIIHRVVKKWEENGAYYFQTKGDNNPDSIRSPGLDETRIGEDMILGNAVLRIPLLGYIKIWFVELIRFISGVLA